MDELDARAAREAWALGDYHRFATDLMWGLGRELVTACRIGPGKSVLDVAAGSGNTALRAAVAGASVVAADLTPENFAPGRREADRMAVEIDWVEADAEDLPFADASFDVVTSSVGVMWAPDHQAVADELCRVCRPGGTIGLLNFAEDGLLSAFLAVFAPYLPPPTGSSPTLWGNRTHVRQLFGDRVGSLDFETGSYTEQVAGGPRGYCEFYKQTFGPVIATYRSLSDQPERSESLDRAFLEFASAANHGRIDGPAELDYEYLLVLARRADS